MSLKDIIIDEIGTSGDYMRLPRFMELCLTHPDYGYYMTRDPFGAAGDFTTAPEISQMFGELIGLWCVAEWDRIGRPAPFVLVEFGPGRGTLMADALRAAGQVRDLGGEFLEAMQLFLCDASPILREHQHAHLAGYKAQWIGETSSLPPLPAFVIANEFFDALPIVQVHGKPQTERVVRAENGTLVWDEAPAQNIPDGIPSDIKDWDGDLWLEYSPISRQIMQELAAHLAKHGGRMLAIDYGYEGPRAGDTLQALKKHQFVNVLEEPGEADLTAHVDMGTLARIAREAGLSAAVTTQGAFLRALGINARAEKLKLRAKLEAAADIDSALSRLTAPDQMGELFKVLIVEASL